MVWPVSKPPQKRSSPSAASDRPGGREADVAAFVEQLRAMPVARPASGRGRLLFALDATASRQHTWDQAMHIQAEMFLAARDVGGLDMQVCFFRGFGEFRASPWMDHGEGLLPLMSSVRCLAGQTQIGRVLQHAINQNRIRRLGALVYVGDCMEEDIDALGALAGQLGLQGVRAFMFHEGRDRAAAMTFQHIARLTGGAYAPFESDSAGLLRRLLCAVAVFAAGGRAALQAIARPDDRAVAGLIAQMR